MLVCWKCIICIDLFQLDKDSNINCCIYLCNHQFQNFSRLWPKIMNRQGKYMCTVRFQKYSVLHSQDRQKWDVWWMRECSYPVCFSGLNFFLNMPKKCEKWFGAYISVAFYICGTPHKRKQNALCKAMHLFKTLVEIFTLHLQLGWDCGTGG